MGGGGAALLAIASDAGEVWAAWAALGVAFELVAAHLLRFRGARILCLCLVPYYAGFVMTPAWVWGAARRARRARADRGGSPERLMRTAIFTVTIIFLLAFLVVTVDAALDRGFTILSLISVAVIVVMGIGIVGALLESLRDDD